MREREVLTMKQAKIIIIIGLIAVAFILGITIGEKRVIKNQKIEKTDYGYLVDFDGQLYDYLAD